MVDLHEGTEALDPDGLYHLATREQWERYRQTGSIAPDSLETEGFVHCSWGRQVAGTVAKHFAAVADLLALHLDPAKLGDADLVVEDCYGSGQAFPHFYGSISVDAVVAKRTVRSL